MHPNEELIQKFYTAFQVRDSIGMCACYHPTVVFSDPVFGRLPAAEATAMWHMLCARAKDLQISFRDIQANAETGRVHWEARYTFGKKSRPVHNVIDATFVFRENLMVQHDDVFDLWKWTRMALGPTGTLLGWTPWLHSVVKKDARRGLDAFIQKQQG
jgi:ketosteroid isomerase-like protein